HPRRLPGQVRTSRRRAGRHRADLPRPHPARPRPAARLLLRTGVSAAPHGDRLQPLRAPSRIAGRPRCGADRDRVPPRPVARARPPGGLRVTLEARPEPTTPAPSPNPNGPATAVQGAAPALRLPVLPLKN